MQGVVGPLVAEDRRPLVGEEVGVVGAVEQPVDETVAFGWVGVGEERARLVERGHASRDVDRGPTQERGIITHARRWQPQRHEPVEHEPVDERADERVGRRHRG
jgi:hypothetical protein